MAEIEKEKGKGNWKEFFKLDKVSLSSIGFFIAFISLIFIFYQLWSDYQRDQAILYTDSYIRAVDQLGATKSENKPNLEVRLGGIYGLEKIARESKDHHQEIIELLCAYIRQNAQNHPKGERAKPPRIDIQAALKVVGRRNIKWEEDDDNFRPDLSRVKLQNTLLNGMHFKKFNFQYAELEGANLYEAHLEGANLYDAHLEGAKLQRAHLEGANLQWAHLEGANLQWAHLEGANLIRANLEGAKLQWAHLEGANLTVAHLEGARLAWAHLEGANLSSADLKGADLGSARLEGADLSSAGLYEANLYEAHLEGANLQWAILVQARLNFAHLERADLKFSGLERADLEKANLKEAELEGANLAGAKMKTAEGLTSEQIDQAFGNAATTLPSNIQRPKKWPGGELTAKQSDDEYWKWYDDKENYQPPE